MIPRRPRPVGGWSGGQAGNDRPPRPCRLPHVVGKGGRLQRPSPFRCDGSGSARRTSEASGPEPAGPGTAVGRLRCGGAGAGVPRKKDVAQGGVAGSAGGGGTRQHLRQRGAPRRRLIAAETGIDPRDSRRRSARGRSPPGGRYQARPREGDLTPVGGRLSHFAVSRLRPTRRTMSEEEVRRLDSAPHAGGTIDLLLPGVPAVVAVPQVYVLQPFLVSSNPSNRRPALAPASVSRRCGCPFSTV
jgi:hypothetical protein